MTNNQDDLNRLINELAFQKAKDRKHHVRIEIAKATDRSVKRALEDILKDIEKKERQNRLIALAIVAAAVLMGFYLIGVSTGEQKEATVASRSVSESSSSEVPVKVIKETSLTEAEVKQWVSALWDKRYLNFPNASVYEQTVSIDDTDQLVYIKVRSPEGSGSNQSGVFRINAKGELEEKSNLVEGANSGEWTVISQTFMDVSQIESWSPATKESTVASYDTLSAEAFAVLYAKWTNSNLPIMPTNEYTEKYGHLTEYDDDLWVIAYNDRVGHTVQVSELTPYRMARIFYTYDNNEQKAYSHRNDASREVEFLPGLTKFIEDNR